MTRGRDAIGAYPNINNFVDILAGRRKLLLRRHAKVPQFIPHPSELFWRENAGNALNLLLNFSGCFSRMTWNLCAIDASYETKSRLID